MEAMKTHARSCRCLIGLIFLGMFSASGAAAQDAQPGKYPWEEFDKRLRSSMDVARLSDDLLGDSVGLSNGALSFSATEVSLESHHALPVSLKRKYVMKNRYQYENDALLADWDLDLPSISGVFSTDWVMGHAAASPGARCSVSTVSQAQPSIPFSGSMDVSDVWSGNSMNIPGVSSGEMLLINGATARPAQGGPYYWMTNDQVFVGCLPAIRNGTGEGFLAVGPDGTRYWFDWMAQYVEPQIKNPLNGTKRLDRRLNVLYATRVEDRFGNSVAYNYANAANAPARLQSIVASDGRQISFSYNPRGQIETATTNGRTWRYLYRSDGKVSLSAVIQPDGSQWKIDFSGLSNAAYYATLPIPNEPVRSCFMDGTPLVGPQLATGRIEHPSGAVGTFTVAIREHGRSNVPISCKNFTTGIGGNDTGDDVNQWAIAYKAYTLIEKSISGPAISPMAWKYSYSSAISSIFYPGGTMDRPCPLTGGVVCGEPICTSDSCAGRATTVVEGPGAEWTRYTHGNSFKYDEGKLLRIERGKGGDILQVVENTYALSPAGRPYPARFGVSAQDTGDNFPREAIQPELSTVTRLDGVVYTRRTNSFDSLARPLSVSRFSSQGDARTDVTEYGDNLGLWVLGQVAHVSSSDTASVITRTTYDGRALPIELHSHGRLLQRYSYNPDGSLSSIADANNHITHLANWKRGVAQTLKFADGTTLVRGVDDNGFVTSVTDEIGAATGYEYDPMGRISRIRYPAGDTVAWADTVRSFSKSSADEYGVAAGHWRQDVSTGNARKRVYYDAFWRPLLTQEFDAASPAETQRFVRASYDLQGRLEFQSYPSASANASTGTWTTYDGLGRVASVSQDSESGLLTTTTSYLAGGLVKVIDPKGRVTTTAYQAFDQPSQTQPIAIAHPGGVFSEIVRDVFGKPLSIKRRNVSSTEALTRTYVYDGHQQLCKSIEPETGSTAMGYDPAGNLLWTASGLALPNVASCDAAAALSSSRRVDRTYDARNRLATLRFPDRNGDQDWLYHADGKPAQVTTLNDGGGAVAVNGYTYNKRRLLTGESLQESAGPALSLGYGYDSNGNRAGIAYPSGMFVGLAPNALGQATQAGPYATAVSYYPNGAIRRFTYGNGVVHSMQQNARQLPAQVVDGNGVLDYSYLYDGAGNVVTILDGVDSLRDRRMEYDQLDRLQQATSAMFGGNGVMRYTYDALDNLRSSSLAGVRDHQYWYDASNRLTNVQATGGSTIIGLDYDPQGNLRNRNGVVHTFDVGNRLRKVAGAESYRYDAYGRRVLSSAENEDRRIFSLYGEDGLLRRQNNERTGEISEYVYLGSSLVAKVVGHVAPGVPSLSVPPSSETGSFSVSWGEVGRAARYELREQRDSGGWTTVYSGAGRAWAASNRSAGIYGYSVRACSSNACGAWSSVGAINVQAEPVDVPIVTVPATSYSGSYVVTWSTVAGASRYELQASTGGAWATLLSANVANHPVSGQPAGSVQYRVRGCNGRGCAAYSAPASIQVILKPAAAPTLSLPASNSSGAYVVSWSQVAGAARYALEQRSGTSEWTQIANAARTSQDVAGRPSGEDGYRVRACNDAGCSSYSAVATTRVLRIPAVAPVMSGNSAQYGSPVVVGWSAVPDGASYALEEQAPGRVWAQVQNSSAIAATLPERSTGTYGYRVRACNASGCGPLSSALLVAVLRAPSAPGLSIDSSNVGSGQGFRVYWGAVATASSYRLEEQFAAGQWTQVLDSAETQFAAGARGAGGYGYRARACNAAGCSGYSAVATFTLVLRPVPDVPGNLNVAEMRSSCEMAWGASARAERYELSNDGGVVYQGANTSFSQANPRRCVSPYRVRACNSTGCSEWSLPVYHGGGAMLLRSR